MIARLRPDLGIAELTASLRPRRAVREFEQAFAGLLGQREAVAFPYGRTALRLLLEALEISKAEVICPAYTCVVVAHAVVASGNTPVFVDCRPHDLNMDLDLASDAVGPNTRAIVATSLFGQPVDLDALDRFTARHPDVLVIQDCAHSFGATWEGRPVQTAGVAALYGLNVSKLMTSIFGGMVTTDSEDVAAALRRVQAARLAPAGSLKEARRLLYLWAAAAAFLPAAYRVVDELARRGLLSRFTDYYEEHVIDMPRDHLRAMAEVEGRVGLVQTRKYADIVAHRRHVASIYDDELAERDGLELPPRTAGATYSHYVVRTERAAAVAAALRDAGVQLGRLIEYVVPHLPAYSGSTFLDRGVARALPARVLNLPVHVGVSAGAAHRIARLTAAAATA